jgi:hypothetical protein
MALPNDSIPLPLVGKSLGASENAQNAAATFEESHTAALKEVVCYSEIAKYACDDSSFYQHNARGNAVYKDYPVEAAK